MSDLDKIFADAVAHRKDKARFRARTRNRIHSLLLKEFAKFSADLPSAKSKIHEITGISKSTVTKILAGPKNLTVDTISDFLLAMGARLEPSSTGAHAVYADVCEERDRLVRENERLREALRSFKRFDDLPAEAKRPDVYDLWVRRPLLAALNPEGDTP